RLLDTLLAATRGFQALAGAGESVPLAELARVAATLPDLRDVDRASAALTQAIGTRFERTSAYQPMPWGTEELPVIATFFPAAVPPDTGIFPILSQSGTAATRVVRAAELAVALGNERALRYLAPEVAPLALAARHTLARPIPTTDLYRSWLAAVRALDRRAPNGADVEPSFMRTEAYADARLGSELVAYGQLRHAYVLYAAQAYDSLGCEIPDAWVEPRLPVFDALLAYVAHARAASTALWGHDESDYYDRLRGVLLALRTIAEHELAGRALSAAEVGFLRMVAEYVPAGTYDGPIQPPPRFNGWYPRMFPSPGTAFARGSFVSDVSTSPTLGAVTYLGATQPRIGLFVVDTGGEPRLMVGPVARGIERIEPLARERLDDRSLRDYAPPALLPWEASYLVRGPLEVDLGIEVTDGAVVLTGDPTVGPVTIELLDRHGEVALRGSGPVSPKGGPPRPIAVAGLRANGPHTYRVNLADGSAWEQNFGWGKFGDRADHVWE
ncbi:MAG: DUF3160 domain-containing protein, partial [Polyangiaceae bacterium]|nr:DUF3160 domain-containing protein [Polyangiaceae bacterium]